MPNTIFTDAGRALIAQCFAENEILDITELVFCDVPGLNVNETPSATAPLPPLAQIVHRATPSKGLFNPTTAVFSTIIDAEIGDFYINYMGLMSGTTLIAVSVMPRHIKYATSEFKTGNSLVKNFALEIQNASALTGITIPAELWMWDFDERYAALDHDHDDQYEVINAVSNHNASEAPHPDKFEPLGAVATHNEDPAAHGGINDENKANINFDNLTLPDALTNLGFNALRDTNGYQKLPGGLIIQWGNTGEGLSDQFKNITLPITYPNAHLCAMATASKNGAVGGSSVISAHAYPTSTSQISLGQSGLDDAGNNVYYLSIGY